MKQQEKTHSVYYVMGVSGCGKTTLGRAIANALGIPFFDADDFHPLSNVQKMKQGIPLTDADRAGWLQAIHAFVRAKLTDNSLVFACSALKEMYRKVLVADMEAQSHWIVLQGNRDVLLARMQQRTDHFMPASLLDSQLKTLEMPAYGLHLSVDDSLESQLEISLSHISHLL